MHTLSFKLTSDFDLKILIEVPMNYDIKSYKEIITTSKDDQMKTISLLQTNAYNYYKVLSNDIRRVIDEKDFTIDHDKENNVTLMKVNFTAVEYFKNYNKDWIIVDSQLTDDKYIDKLRKILASVEDILDELK